METKHLLFKAEFSESLDFFRSPDCLSASLFHLPATNRLSLTFIFLSEASIVQAFTLNGVSPRAPFFLFHFTIASFAAEELFTRLELAKRLNFKMPIQQMRNSSEAPVRVGIT